MLVAQSMSYRSAAGRGRRGFTIAPRPRTCSSVRAAHSTRQSGHLPIRSRREVNRLALSVDLVHAVELTRFRGRFAPAWPKLWEYLLTKGEEGEEGASSSLFPLFPFLFPPLFPVN